MLNAGVVLYQILRRLFIVPLILGISLGPTLGFAQEPADATASSPPAEEETLPPDPFNRRSPERMVFGLLAALAEQDYQKAAQYLDLSALPRAQRQARGPLLARQLQTLLDHAGWIRSPRQLSSDPAGRLDDGLAPNLDHFATIRTPQSRVDLLLERHDDPEFGPIWQVASETVAEIPYLAAAIDTGLLERYLPEALSGGPRLAGVPLGHWLALVLIAVAAYLLAWLLLSLFVLAIEKLWEGPRHTYIKRFLRDSQIPLRIFVVVWIFSFTAFLLGLPIIARQYSGMLAEGLAWAALAWLAWRAIDAFADYSIEKLTQRGQVSALSALRFFRRGAKAALAVIAGMAALESLGFNVTTGLAALGIGGLALALGAQKTVENLVGSLTLIADRPVRVGDFCGFGGRTGTVEDIGIRSTRIRTLDRTIVTVPNGEFASMQIENFSPRDRFLFAPVLKLRYETSADQIRFLLVELRALLYAHPKVDPASARIRFQGLGTTSLDLEVFSYIQTADFDDFLEVREDLTLRMMDKVAESGTGFALPSQTVYVAEDAGLSEAKAQAAEEQVREWVEQDELQLPQFQAERIEALRNTIDYPPKGSVNRR